MNYITKKDLLKCYRDGILVPEQDGKQWTQHERDRLVTLYDDGWGISEMALDLQRTENGIVNQLICMNRLIPPRSRRKRSPRKKSHKCKGCPYNFSTNIYTLERLQHLQPQINSRPVLNSYHPLMNIHINTFCYTLCYSIKSKKLLLEECKEMTHTPHSVKFLSLGPLHCSILQQNTDFLEVLYRITGGNVKALDDFAQLLAKIVAPVPKYPSLAVVFTKKNVKAVRRFFLQLFRQKCKEAGSAIRILQQGREAEILAHQVRGGMLVLLNDQLPSDTKVGKFLSLIHGKKYPLKNKYICIRSDIFSQPAHIPEHHESRCHRDIWAPGLPHYCLRL